jgi:hypothetical protein
MSQSDWSTRTYAVPSASRVEVVVPTNGVVRIVRANSRTGLDVVGSAARAGRTDAARNAALAERATAALRIALEVDDGLRGLSRNSPSALRRHSD